MTREIECYCISTRLPFLKIGNFAITYGERRSLLRESRRIRLEIETCAAAASDLRAILDIVIRALIAQSRV